MTKTALITGACINTGVAIVEKFAQEGWDVVFTGRSIEKVREAEQSYREKYPNVKIDGYAINSLLDEKTVDEQAIDDLFAYFDKKNKIISSMLLIARA